MKLFFLTFGADTKNFHDAVDRICNQAEKFDLFDEIIGLSEKDLIKDTEFWNNHSNFILNNKKGYGYWIWKPYLIHKYMNEKLNFGDIICFLDCGCELNINGKKRFVEYIDMVNKYDTLGMQIEHEEKKWTKYDLIHRLNAENFENTGQIESGIQFYKKTQKNIDLIKEIYNLCIENNYHFINDEPSLLQNDIKFVEHRHDQSILSLIFKKNNCFVIKDETYFHDKRIRGKNFPIFAMRNKTGISRLNF